MRPHPSLVALGRVSAEHPECVSVISEYVTPLLKTPQGPFHAESTAKLPYGSPWLGPLAPSGLAYRLPTPISPPWLPCRSLTVPSTCPEPPASGPLLWPFPVSGTLFPRDLRGSPPHLPSSSKSLRRPSLTILLSAAALNSTPRRSPAPARSP